MNCPSCGVTLRVPEGYRVHRFTCPRCLAIVDNPGAAPALPGDMRPCPVCAEQIRVAATLCRWCKEPVDDDGQGFEKEVSRDSNRMSVGLVVLALVGIVGILQLILQSRDSVPDVIKLLFIGAFLAAAGAGFWLMRQKDNPKARGVGRVIVGTLAVAGGLVALMLLAAFAFIAFLFAVCLLEGFKI